MIFKLFTPNLPQAVMQYLINIKQLTEAPLSNVMLLAIESIEKSIRAHDIQVYANCLMKELQQMQKKRSLGPNF